jgi:hypothetical protein
MRNIAIAFMVTAALVAGSGSAAAQWGYRSTPSVGACFYEDINYSGRYFCVPVDEDVDRVPSGTDDEISSIRLFGYVEVEVYRDSNLRGESRRFTSNISDLTRVGLNDKVTSLAVRPRGQGGWGGNWGGAYGGSGGYDSGQGSWGHGHSSGQSSWGGAYGGGGSHGSWSGSSNGGRWTYEQARDIVRRAYRSTLNREPDPGAESWVTQVMKKNMSQSQLEAELRKSAEYRSKH